MTPQPSRAVKAGYVLVNVLLVIAVVSTAVVAVSIAVGLVRHGDSLLYGDTLWVSLELSPDDVRSLPDGIRVDGWPDVEVEVTDPTTKQMLLRSLPELGPLALLAAGLWLLRGFMRSVLAGDPFGAANVRRLRAGGFILVVGAPVVWLINYSLRQSLFSDLPPHPSVNLGMEGFALPATALVAGLGAYILAEVFAYGLRLREDVEATI